MSSLALLEVELLSPLYVTGQNNVDVFFGVDGVYCCHSSLYGCGGSDGGLNGAMFKQEVGIGCLPKMAHSAPPPLL